MVKLFILAPRSEALPERSSAGDAEALAASLSESVVASVSALGTEDVVSTLQEKVPSRAQARGPRLVVLGRHWVRSRFSIVDLVFVFSNFLRFS